MKPLMITICLLLTFLCASFAYAQDAKTLKRASLYEALMIEAGARHGVDPRLLWTIAYLETGFRPDQVSAAGARGMMQFMPLTAKRYGLDDPHHPEAAIDAAARYLRKLQEMFNHRLDLVLAAYNSGEETVMAYRDGRKLLLSNGKVINPQGIKTGGVPPYRETYLYVNKGIALFLRLVRRREDGNGIAFAHLKTPERINEEEPMEPLPHEITQLKQGSIYLIDSTPRVSSSSIYPQ